MRNRRELWLLHSVARAYGCRPSAVLGIEDDWLAYQVDVAALAVGLDVEQKTMDGKTSVEKALGADNSTRGQARTAGASQSGQYRDPRPMVTKVMKIPESGIW